MRGGRWMALTDRNALHGPSRISRLALPIACIAVLLSAHAVFAQTPAAEEKFPFRQRPVDYFSDEHSDPLAEFSRKLESGEIKLQASDGPMVYLISLLKELKIPVESQLLTFSAIARNSQLQSPGQPRAIYFNDEVQVGYIPGSPELELMACDPVKGAIFYKLRQLPDAPPRLEREDDCVQCHASVEHSEAVPGLLLRSMIDLDNGTQKMASLTLQTPLRERWGMWYVTGKLAQDPHRGNRPRGGLGDRDQPVEAWYRSYADLRAQIGHDRYPSFKSDVVAQLVFAHQVPVQNLMIRIAYEHAFRSPRSSEDRLVKAMLFCGEAPLTGPVEGSNEFARLFMEQGKKDPKQRSLRDLELNGRTFRYRMSYLIDSTQFAQLPRVARERIWRRFELVLSGRDESPDYAHLDAAERSAIREILLATHPELPASWGLPVGD